ncbi:MAG: hypothetical protein ACPGXK_06305 [Phycisphaerae bacterium]
MNGDKIFNWFDHFALIQQLRSDTCHGAYSCDANGDGTCDPLDSLTTMNELIRRGHEP